MDLELSNEQALLRTTIERMAARHGIDEVRACWPNGHQADLYAALRSSGALELVATDVGFAAWTHRLVVLESLGRGCATTPIVASAGFCAHTLAACAPSDRRTHCMDAIGEGAAWVPALADPPRGERCPKLSPEGPVARLTGRMAHVGFAAVAAGFLVRARTVDDDIVVVAVDTDRPGVTVHASASSGGEPAGRVELVDVDVADDDIVAHGRDVVAALGRGFAAARLLQAAYLLGQARRVVELTCAHVRERHQFRRALAEFQAVQHHLADCHVALELAWLHAYSAAWTADEADGYPDTALAASSKAMASEAAAMATRWGHQLHGGVGAVDDHEVSLHRRRALAVSLAYGAPGELWDEVRDDQQWRLPA